MCEVHHVPGYNWTVSAEHHRNSNNKVFAGQNLTHFSMRHVYIDLFAGQPPICAASMHLHASLCKIRFVLHKIPKSDMGHASPSPVKSQSLAEFMMVSLWWQMSAAEPPRRDLAKISRCSSDFIWFYLFRSRLVQDRKLTHLRKKTGQQKNSVIPSSKC